MILGGEFPPDGRVEKEAVSLIENGHKVTIACQTIVDRPSDEIYEDIIIKRLKLSKLDYKLSAAILTLPFHFKKWIKFISTFENKFDAIHVHDLPLAKIGYYFSKKWNCKLILDQHEYYSDWIVRTAHMNTLFGKIIKLFSNWKNYEKKYLNKADLVITVAEPLRKNYIQEYYLNEHKIITIPNTPSSKVFNDENINQEIIDAYKDQFILFYAGGIDMLRGIDMAIEALILIKEKIPNIKLVLAGKIIKPYDPLAKALLLKVDHLIEYIGWINECDLPSYIKASSICFFTPNPNNKEINNTIATKVYQYAMMSCPQIVSEAKMMKDYVEQNNLGYAVKDEKEFAERVIEHYKNNTNPTTLNNKVNSWENTVLPLIKYYNTLVRKSS